MPTIEPHPVPPGDFEAYIFDCDGTLADSMPAHYRAWVAAIEPQDGEFPEKLFYEWGGKPGAEIVDALNRRSGYSLDVAATVAAKEAHYLSCAAAVRPIASVVERARLARGKIRIAVASGGHRNVVSITLDAIGIADWFETIVCAEDYQRGKPAPDPYLEAARRLNVAPERCLVFEDTITGIDSATAAGMRSVFVGSPAL